jgi:hypothetical protein
VGWPNSPDSDVDAMLAQMKRARRKRVFIGLSVIAGLAAVGGLQLLNVRMSAASELRHRGYSSFHLKSHGPFSLGFTGQKGTAQCGGTYERVLFSSSIQESCFDLPPPAPPAPKVSIRDDLEQSLRRKLAALGFDTFTCPDVPPGARTTTCTVSAKNGTNLSVTVTALNTDPDGGWQSWHMELASRVGNGESLAADLLKSVHKQRPHSEHLVFDCGTGPQVATNEAFTCEATDTKTHRKGTITVTFDDKGSHWKLKL